MDDPADSRDNEPEPDPTPRASFSGNGTPAPLTVAAALTFVEGLLTFLLGIAEVVNLSLDRWVMGVTTSLFFVAYGAALVACAWGLHRVRTWARGPVLLAQLIYLGLAWSFRGGETVAVAVALAVVAVVVLAGVLHPRSMEALERAARHS